GERAEEEDASGVVRVGRELRDAGLGQAAGPRLERASAVVGCEDAFSLRADVEAAGPTIDLERRDHEGLARNARPGRAAVVGAVEPAHGRGVHDPGARRVPAHAVGAPVREAAREAGPAVAAIA